MAGSPSAEKPAAMRLGSGLGYAPMPTSAAVARSQRARLAWMPSSWTRDRLRAAETKAGALVFAYENF